MIKPAVSAERASIGRTGVPFLGKVFRVFAALALLSLCISAGGKWVGRSLALAGHTEDTASYEIVIGSDVVSAPANLIRFEQQRRNGAADRLDLYLRWPQMDGYSAGASDDFNHASGSRKIIFLTFEPRLMAQPMSGRLEPVYRQLLGAGSPGPGGTTIHALDDRAGYLDEELAVAQGDGAEPFVARCLREQGDEIPLAPCERDIHVGSGLSVTYRFPRDLLAEWKTLDAAVRARVASMLEAGAAHG
jgi:hypothetical protein